MATETGRGVYCFHPLRRKCLVPLHLVLSAVTQHCYFKSYTHGLVLGDLTLWRVPFTIEGSPLCSTPHLLASFKAHPQGSVILLESWKMWHRSWDLWDLEDRISAALWLRTSSCHHPNGSACMLAPKREESSWCETRTHGHTSLQWQWRNSEPCGAKLCCIN